MTANAMCGLIGAVVGGAACFSLGYHCALLWVLGVLQRNGVDLDSGTETEETGS